MDARTFGLKHTDNSLWGLVIIQPCNFTDFYIEKKKQLLKPALHRHVKGMSKIVPPWELHLFHTNFLEKFSIYGAVVLH